ncbi:MAG: UDP-glucose 6-dehydrogenase tuaD, partial [Candidatus Gottesmanbacteria bacterium GW2011_GWA2_42_16]
ALQNAGAKIRAFDPVAMENAKKLLHNVTYLENAYEVASGVDALVVITEWNEFKQLDLKKILTSMKHPILFDGRNMYDPVKVRKQGFEYFGVGRS